MPREWFQGLKVRQLRDIAAQEEFELEPGWDKKEILVQLGTYMELQSYWARREKDQKELAKVEREMVAQAAREDKDRESHMELEREITNKDREIQAELEREKSSGEGV